ncbi:MAG: hypothetical protein ABSA11_17145 [Candidatus Bathyarchaeia archaeon]
MNVEEASQKVFNDNMERFERGAIKSFTDPEDSQALADLIVEWRRLG